MRVAAVCTHMLFMCFDYVVYLLSVFPVLYVCFFHVLCIPGLFMSFVYVLCLQVSFMCGAHVS